jgi:hypothetical protein
MIREITQQRIVTPVRTARCEWCGDRGTQRDPVRVHIVTPPNWYDIELMITHARCADDAARNCQGGTQ